MPRRTAHEGDSLQDAIFRAFERYGELRDVHAIGSLAGDLRFVVILDLSDVRLRSSAFFGDASLATHHTCCIAISVMRRPTNRLSPSDRAVVHPNVRDHHAQNVTALHDLHTGSRSLCG